MKKRLRKKKIKENLTFLDHSLDDEDIKEYLITIDPIYKTHKPTEVYTKYTPYAYKQVRDLVGCVINKFIQCILSMIGDYKE